MHDYERLAVHHLGDMWEAVKAATRDVEVLQAIAIHMQWHRDNCASADAVYVRLWSWCSGISLASVNTASWFPASGVSVNTSATTLRKLGTRRS